MGFATTDLDNFKILEDIPSFPVAFFIPILLISLFASGAMTFYEGNNMLSALL